MPVASALAQHRNADRRLAFPAMQQVVVEHTGHLELLSSPAVYRQLSKWLA